VPTPTIGRNDDIAYEARLRRRGIGRYVSAAFLGVWLCGWLLGECFALWVLIGGAIALVSGESSASDGGPVQLSAAVAIALFLLVWLAFWTLGGIAAATQLLRELWGEDRITTTSDSLVLEWRAGPFRRRRTIARGEIVDLVLLPRGRGLVVDTARERVEAAQLGSEQEWRALAVDLRRELGIREGTRLLSPALPEEWTEVATPEGGFALAPNPRTRALPKRVAAVVACVLIVATAVFMNGAAGDPSWLVAALVGTATTAALCAGVAWLELGRNEWRIESGRLVLQRRFRDRVTERFHATRLALTESADSDGDDWFELLALREGATAAIFPTRGDRRNRRRIVRRMNDDAVPRRLGLWLATRAGIPLDDHTTSRHAR